jgi:hypothetical protein
LLQFALKETWGKRDGDRLTAEAYTEVGGVVGAIEKTAQDAYERLTPAQKDAARRLFLRLVTPGEGQADTRARSAIPDDPEQRGIVSLFANPKTRLLVTGYETLQGTARTGSEARSTVEVAHEALIQRWSTLRDWVRANRENMRARAAILRSKAEWEENGESEKFLLDPGVQLERGRALLANPGDVAVDDIRDFVSRSIEKDEHRLAAVRKRERKRLYIITGATTALAFALLSVLVTLYLFHSRQQEFIDANIVKLRRGLLANNDALSQEEQDQLMRVMNDIVFLESFGRADIDLTSIPLRDLKLRDFVFDNLHLSDAKIRNVDLSSSVADSRNLINSSFSGSDITNSRFTQSDLLSSQFRNAKLQRVDFLDANLKRASFDEARLCDVNFSGANLLHATFSNAILDRKTILSLRDSAWWLADGWTAPVVRQLELLAGEQRPDLSRSRGFNTDRKNRESDVAEAQKAADAFNLAIKLNDLAWFLTINGVALLPTPQEQAQGTAEPGSGADCGARNDIPQSAKAAAVQAVCLIGRASGAHKDTHQTHQSSFEDTLGYIYLQSGNIDEALLNLGKATDNGSKDAAEDALFRLAVAENAAGRIEDALTHMKLSIGKGYVPTHERALLAKYLSQNDFAAQLDQALIRGKNTPVSADVEMTCPQ